MQFKLVFADRAAQRDFSAPQRLGAGIHIRAEAAPAGHRIPLLFKAGTGKAGAAQQ